MRILGYLFLTTMLITTSVSAQETQMETTPAQSPMMEQSEATAALEEQSGFNPGTVARSTFTSSIVDREPVDTLQQITAMEQKVYFFTELRDMEGQTATHRWQLNGEVMAEVAFEVKGTRWRVWSSKNLLPQSAGEWKVSVLNGANEVISETSLNVTPEAVDEPVPATEAPAESNI